MNKKFAIIVAAAFAACSSTFAPVQAQTGADEARMEEQREALAPLVSMLQGHWRGTAETRTPAGAASLIQTERVGPMLDGTIVVIEGRGHAADGTMPFNAFAVVSFDPDKDEYRIRSWANGRGGDFPLWLTDTGFRWEIPAGPATIRYVATVEGNSWREIGTYEREDMEPMTIVDMTLEKIGETEWPLEGAVLPE